MRESQNALQTAYDQQVLLLQSHLVSQEQQKDHDELKAEEKEVSNNNNVTINAESPLQLQQLQQENAKLREQVAELKSEQDSMVT